MFTRLFELIRRGWRKPPHVIARWLATRLAAEIYQFRAPARARALTPDALLAQLGGGSMDALWRRLADAPFPTYMGPVTGDEYDKACPGGKDRILAAADDALAGRVNLLGSGPVDLDNPIPWHRDFKSGYGWPIVLSRRIDVLDLHRHSDIKAPWELSRLQWLIPAGQAYLLSGEERYAEAVRAVIEDWAAANPLARGVNWACTMDVALRGITLVWLFRAFHGSAAWHDNAFRQEFLKLLYLHGDFTIRHLEWSDINGNHLLSNAAGLVVMGLFFKAGDTPLEPTAWQQKGWGILESEIDKQVSADGVDFEVSTAYQRLVTELFVLPALYRRACKLEVSGVYENLLKKMAGFTAAYSRPDGTIPLWGDADDGRVLPFAHQPDTINDHRYLIALIGQAFGDSELAARAAGSKEEVFWTLGPDAAAAMSDTPAPSGSQIFPDGGVCIMRAGNDHVFIDCGPVGMKGRGGHGHNDCLSFDAMLAGVSVITDCGTYVYSADPDWRNDFRSTAFHNTPMIDAEEVNRFQNPNFLWTLKNDAIPELRHWQSSDASDVFVGAHSGYRRLASPVTPVRGIMLDKKNHRLLVADRFEREGRHSARIPYHFSPDVEVEETGPNQWTLSAGGKKFLLVSNGGDHWTAAMGEGWVSPSYGIKKKAPVLNFLLSGALQPLLVGIMPADNIPDNIQEWLEESAAKFSH
ncbi:MAG: alginate lyase family protein [Proteobacteria bacterium]|nr:alginate lyase family protein [Pseudomonadota bacterium]MDA1023217.1 alginate lyase family protein [Pseudomonadota bacterium]